MQREYALFLKMVRGMEMLGKLWAAAAVSRAFLWLLLPAVVTAMQLPPEIQADRYLLQAEQAVRDQNFGAARAAMESLQALQGEHGLEPPPEDHYRYAQVWEAAGRPKRAMEAAVRYLQLRGREAEHYTEALELMNRVKPADAAGESRMFDGMEFVWVPAGEFLMGSDSSQADDDEQPVTRVRISRGFWLGKYEVTQEQWEAVMGSNPSYHTEANAKAVAQRNDPEDEDPIEIPDVCSPNCPVERVSWHEVQDFIRRLNERAGENRYRLPSGAEWEYAARAGTSGDRYGNPDAIGWHRFNSRWRTHTVGKKAPNAWGLHDMLGNVWEWVQDCWNANYLGAPTDGSAWEIGDCSRRVLRGGSRYSPPGFLRAASRRGYSSGLRNDNFGFRVARTLTP